MPISALCLHLAQEAFTKVTNHSLVAVLSGIAVVAHGPSKPSCEQVIASPESCMAGQDFSPHPRCVGGHVATLTEKEEFSILLDLPTFYSERLRNQQGNAHPELCSTCPRIPLSAAPSFFSSLPPAVLCPSCPCSCRLESGSWPLLGSAAAVETGSQEYHNIAPGQV